MGIKVAVAVVESSVDRWRLQSLQRCSAAECQNAVLILTGP